MEYVTICLFENEKGKIFRSPPTQPAFFGLEHHSQCTVAVSQQSLLLRFRNSRCPCTLDCSSKTGRGLKLPNPRLRSFLKKSEYNIDPCRLNPKLVTTLRAGIVSPKNPTS